MRILFTFIFAALLTVFAEGVGVAQMMGEQCHDQEQIIAEEVENHVCCCLNDMHMTSHGSYVETIAGAACCPSHACTNSVVLKDLVISLVVFPPVSTAKTCTPYLVQPARLCTLRLHYSGVPPPRWPSAPVYIHNCSFLI